jgi:hypothetical protein
MQSPELSLRHPAEMEGTASQSSYDEGAGCGFDQSSPDAYAERWVEIAGDPASIARWFAAELAGLGWQQVDRPVRGEAEFHFRRDADERAGVLLQRKGGWAEVRSGGASAVVRVHVAVEGVFDDGRPGVRVG